MLVAEEVIVRLYRRLGGASTGGANAVPA